MDPHTKFTFVVIETSKKDKFLEHINSMDLHTQFTTAETRTDGSIPFLDTFVMTQPDNSLITNCIQKAPHTDLYLQWDSNHNLVAKV